MAAIEIFKNERFGEIRVAGTSEKPYSVLLMYARCLNLETQVK